MGVVIDMRLIDADALMESSMYEFWQDGSAITPIGEYVLSKFRNLIRSMPTIEPEPHWIPVTERLPGEDEMVFVYLFGDSPYIAWIDSNGEWCTEEFTLDEDEYPTAWLPLPEPYKEE